MLKVFMWCLLLAGFAVPALADDQPDCENGSQAELNMCAYNDFTRADKELNTLWPQVKKFAVDGDAALEDNDKGYVKALLASQRVDCLP